MMTKWVGRLFSLVLVAVLLISGLGGSVNASSLTGQYLDDGLTVVSTLRATFDNTSSPETAQADAAAVIEEFASRYHGNRFEKLQSFTTLRTVFNTVASSYRNPSKRPISAEKVERILSQLTKAEESLRRNS